MKKSKSSSKRRERSKSRSDDSKSKRAKPRSRSREKEKSRQNSRTAPRKTRWETSDSKDDSKKAQIVEPATKEKSGPPLRIKDLLHNKEKIVDLLFQTVTGAALQELIPDYLQKRSKEELKKLCLEQIKTMSDELILQIISGKFESANKDKEEKVEKEQNLKPEQPCSVDVKEKDNVKEKDAIVETEKKIEKISSKMEDKLPRESPEIEIIEVKEKTKDEILIPEDIKEEVAKDLLLSERDAELLELEMRARAIRSLLKAKSNVANENEDVLKDNH